MSLDGQPGTGRTRFALSAPRPIWLIELDKGGSEGLLEDATDINIARYPYAKNITQADAKDIANEVERDIIEARDSGRTVVIDKADGLWQLFRLAEFGRLAGVQSRKYEGVNTRMSELLRSFVDTDTNLLLIHDLQDEYSGDSPTGKKTRAGFSGVDGIVRHAASFSGGVDGVPFNVTITRCTPHWPAVGMVFDDETGINFQTYALNAVPQVDPDAWL
jgi:hypothetical protein